MDQLSEYREVECSEIEDEKREESGHGGKANRWERGGFLDLVNHQPDEINSWRQMRHPAYWSERQAARVAASSESSIAVACSSLPNGDVDEASTDTSGSSGEDVAKFCLICCVKSSEWKPIAVGELAFSGSLCCRCHSLFFVLLASGGDELRKVREEVRKVIKSMQAFSSLLNEDVGGDSKVDSDKPQKQAPVRLPSKPRTRANGPNCNDVATQKNVLNVGSNTLDEKDLKIQMLTEKVAAVEKELAELRESLHEQTKSVSNDDNPSASPSSRYPDVQNPQHEINTSAGPSRISNCVSHNESEAKDFDEKVTTPFPKVCNARKDGMNELLINEDGNRILRASSEWTISTCANDFDELEETVTRDSTSSSVQSSAESPSPIRNIKKTSKQSRKSDAGQRFCGRDALRKHERATHSRELSLRYRCSYCDKKFSWSGHLKIHERTHTGEKPYQCDLCPKAFSREDSMVIHRRVHTGEKPYTCDTCRKGFSRKIGFKMHQRSHSGERPYECKSCGKRFSRRSNLQRHVRIHDGNRQFVCVFCGKPFTQYHHLWDHIRSHTVEKPYECSKCDKVFSRRFGLNKHAKAHCSFRC